VYSSNKHEPTKGGMEEVLEVQVVGAQ